jgi:hypothetical protein
MLLLLLPPESRRTMKEHPHRLFGTPRDILGSVVANLRPPLCHMPQYTAWVGHEGDS